MRSSKRIISLVLISILLTCNLCFAETSSNDFFSIDVSTTPTLSITPTQGTESLYSLLCNITVISDKVSRIVPTAFHATVKERQHGSYVVSLTANKPYDIVVFAALDEDNTYLASIQLLIVYNNGYPVQWKWLE